MSLKLAVFILGVATLAGVAFGYFLRWALTFGKKGSLELKIQQMTLNAQGKYKEIINKAEEKAEQILKKSTGEEKEKQQEFKKTEDRLIKKEDFLDKRQTEISAETKKIEDKIKKIEEIRETINKIKEKEESELEKIAQLSKEEAQNKLLKTIESNYEEDLNMRLHKLEQSGEEKLERKARDILITSIHRMGNSVASNVLSTTINIPSDDIKGKIIGKEGKNIRAFERASGTEIIVDDTPGSITISSYDPIRRQIAKVALENLIVDGRIQPARIEDFVEKAKEEINKVIKKQGEQAVYECGILNLDPRIISILGRLHFRTSYGQNVLQHSIEMSHVARMLAEELGADINIAKTGALLHDIGKAVDHEIQGTHVEIGRRILQKFGADEKIIQAMQSHHEEYPYETIESVIVQIADSISGGRPGARRDNVENYLKRLKELEDITNSFEGIDKTYAVQAGKEIRILVKPENISDLEAKKLAREIALKIEKELKYPGEIKVNVIRESRVIEYAR
ncbi:MAG: ribonuclease Y [Candidatus Pacebacteria bacterium]|nr:ribonuclease Y [Candidatus Paceibacterota bacterium]